MSDFYSKQPIFKIKFSMQSCICIEVTELESTTFLCRMNEGCLKVGIEV